MDFLIFFGFSILVMSYFSFFNKKLLVLLIVEFMMLYLIFFFFCGSCSNNFSPFIGLMLSIFMVLDSVFGVSLLISSSRMSSNSSPHFYLN